MSPSLRTVLLAVMGVVLAVALSLGAFALAGGSIGEPAKPVPVDTTESEHQTPSERPTPTETERPEPTKTESPEPGETSETSEPTRTATQTQEPTETHTSEPGEDPSSESPTATPTSDDSGSGDPDHDDD